jgi:hypothetical protein
MNGDWRNTEPTTDGLTRVVVDYSCNHLSCPIGGPCDAQTAVYYLTDVTMQVRLRLYPGRRPLLRVFTYRDYKGGGTATTDEWMVRSA